MLRKIATEFFEALAPVFGGFVGKIAYFTEQAIAKVLLALEHLFRALPDNLGEGISKILAQLFVRNPHQQDATMKLAGQISTSVGDSRHIIAMALLACLALTFCSLIAPMLYKWAFRRRLSVFVSFNRMRTDVAETVHAFLEKRGFRVCRIPYDERAQHQVTLQKIVELLRQCQLMLCIPGPSYSFVESEVMAATTLGRPVVLLGSGADGTIPNTADKRYPVFQIEKLKEQDFAPIEPFLSFIGGDLRSVQRTCAQAFRQGATRGLSAVVMIGTAVAIAVLWIMCFISVLNTPALLVAAPQDPMQKYIALTGPYVVLGIFASIALLCAVYCGCVILSLFEQMRAQRRAQLKLGTDEFRRDDWRDFLGNIASGDPIYQAMAETAPRAHHEKAFPARPA